MKLYAMPFACSLAAHVALREAGLAHEVVWVSRETLRMQDGGDFRAVSPKGKVAALVLDDGTLLTENVAVLLYIADRSPGALRAPPVDSPQRARLHEWLGFVSTELHKQVLWPHFNAHVPVAMKEHVAQRILPGLLPHVAEALVQGPFLFGADFSVADAFLFWTLLLIPRLGVALEPYPALIAFRDTVATRPSVRAVLALEREMLAWQGAGGNTAT